MRKKWLAMAIVVVVIVAAMVGLYKHKENRGLVKAKQADIALFESECGEYMRLLDAIVARRMWTDMDTDSRKKVTDYAKEVASLGPHFKDTTISKGAVAFCEFASEEFKSVDDLYVCIVMEKEGSNKLGAPKLAEMEDLLEQRHNYLKSIYRLTIKTQ
jgi:hypothetical protein